MVVLLGTLAHSYLFSEGLRKGHAHDQEAARKELAGLQAATPDLESWEKRKATVKAGILAGAKLSTLPERTPLNPRFIKKRVHKGYQAENVAIESSPGFYVTGTLYRPTGFKGSWPEFFARMAMEAAFVNRARSVARSSPGWALRSSSMT